MLLFTGPKEPKLELSVVAEQRFLIMSCLSSLQQQLEGHLAGEQLHKNLCSDTAPTGHYSD